MKKEVDRTLHSVGNGYRLCILGGLSGWIGDRTRVSGENDYGRRLVEFYEERGLCVGNTYFKHKGLHKYTLVARDRDGVEIKSIIGLVLVKRDMLQYVQEGERDGTRPLRSPCYTV